MGFSAGFDTLVAAGTFFEVEDEEALRLHEALLKELVQGSVGNEGVALFLHDVFAEALSRRCARCWRRTSGKRSSIWWKSGREDADDFYVVKRDAGCGANAAVKEAHLAEVAAAREIGEDHFLACPRFWETLTKPIRTR